MGITGLLPELTNSIEPICIEDMTGAVVAIDASCWLHRGKYSCAKELFLGHPTNGYVRFFMNQINNLLLHGITPLVVFDGEPLPAKAEVTAERRLERAEARQKAWIAYKSSDSKFRDQCSSALEVTPDMVDNVIKALKEKGIDYVVAPYEADAQLALMSMSGTAEFIITEDSDLLVFGAKQVIYKWDGYRGDLIRHTSLYRSFLEIPNFTFQTFQFICILTGCDYLKNIPNIGIQRAKTFVKAVGHEDIFKEIKNIGAYIGRSITVPPDYPEKMRMALNTFTHQTVYNPDKGYTPLHEYPPGLTAVDMEYAGLPLPRAAVADLSRTWVTAEILNRTDQTDYTFDETPSSSDADSTKTPTLYNLRSKHTTTQVATVFSIGERLRWTPPCFPVMTIDFFTGTLSSDQSSHTPCLFKASDHRILLDTPPFDIRVLKSCTINAENKSYLVVWEWEYFSLPDNYSEDMSQLSQTTCSSYDTEVGYDWSDTESDTSFECETVDLESEAEEGEHELPFKVLGVTYKERRQVVLGDAYVGMYEQFRVPKVDVVAEPSNPRDVNAIAVRLYTERGPEIVGYIPRELTQYIHPILNTDRLLHTRVGHISFRTTWLHIGLYMKLLITKKGRWEPAVLKASYYVK